MPQYKDMVRLRHMLEYAREAMELAQGKERKQIDADRVLSLALVRLMEIIGEAANRITPEYRSRYPSIPWLQIVSLRNRLIHGYDSVDMEIVWEILTTDLPALVKELETIVLRESGG